MWLNNIENKEVVTAIFGENEPSLNGVTIKELKLDYNGPTVEVRVELNDYPSTPPKKWVLKKYNTVDLTFQLIGIESISIERWNTFNNSDLSISNTNDNMIIKANGECVFEIKIKWIRIDSISAYQVEV